MHSCPTGVMSGISDNTLQISWDQRWEPEIFYTKLYWHTVYVYLHRHLLCNYWLLAPPVWHLPWISGQDPSLFWSIQNIDPFRLKKWEMNMTTFSMHASQVAHLAGTYPGFFCGTEEYLFYSCLKGFPEHQICKGPFTPPGIEWHFERKVPSPK